MRDMSSVPSRHIMDYPLALGMREKTMLFRDSDRIGGNNGPTGMGTHLRISTVGTIVASTYSLLSVVPGVPM